MYKKLLFLFTLASVLVVGAVSFVFARNFFDNFDGLSSFNSLAGITVIGQEPLTVMLNNDYYNEGIIAAPLAPIVVRPARHFSLIPVNDVATLVGYEINVRKFLAFYEYSDDVGVEILYPQEINWNNPGITEVVLNVVANGVSARELASIYILEPANVVQLEFGTPLNALNPHDFVNNAMDVGVWAYFNILIEETDKEADALGFFNINAYLNGIRFTTQIEVVDTTPPTATMMDITIRLGRDISPWDFIYEVYDISPPILAVFTNTPNITEPGQQDISIAISDYFGNTATHSAVLTILPNTTPPTITGAYDINATVGTPIMFRQGVSAEDAFGNPLTLNVDSSLVNVHEIGVYTVTYYAVDSGGLRTEVTVNVNVNDPDTYQVRVRVAEILENILNEEMNQVDKARAIFNWIGANIAYAAGFEPYNVYDGAHQALLHRRGDCFVFYSISEVMLTVAGIPNMRIDRYGGQNRHVWNLINPDNMGWFHFDTTPIRATGVDRFMFTNSQAERFTQMIFSQVYERNYFTFDRSLYPEIVE